MKLRAKLITIFDRTMEVLMVIAGIASVLMMLGISADVIGRYFLNSPILGMLEASNIVMLYITFFATAWVLREEGHVLMDFLPNYLKPRARAWLNTLTSIVCAIITIVFIWYGFKVVLDLFQRGTTEIGNLKINSGYVLLAIPVGSIPLFLQFIRRAYRYWKEARASTVTSQAANSPIGHALKQE